MTTPPEGADERPRDEEGRYVRPPEKRRYKASDLNNTEFFRANRADIERALREDRIDADQ